MLNGSETGGGESRIKTVRLANGAEVAEPTVIGVMLNLESVLEEHGALAAIDLRDIAEGRQPHISHWGDMRPKYQDRKLCQIGDNGLVSMHDDVAQVVVNAVFVNPRDAFDCRLADPRQPFNDFEGSA